MPMLTLSNVDSSGFYLVQSLGIEASIWIDIFFLIKWRNLVLCFNQLVLQTIFTNTDPKGGTLPKRKKNKHEEEKRRREKSNMCFDFGWTYLRRLHRYLACKTFSFFHIFYLCFVWKIHFSGWIFICLAKVIQAKMDVRQTVIMLHYGMFPVLPTPIHTTHIYHMLML